MLPFYRAWLAIRDLQVADDRRCQRGRPFGAGLALALACDLRYAAEDAKLARAVHRSRACMPEWQRPACCHSSAGSPWRASCSSPAGS